jgi:hypothetical protein
LGISISILFNMNVKNQRVATVRTENKKTISNIIATG